MGVQQSLRLRLTSKLVQQAPRDGKDFPDKVRVKLTGDGTRIARGQNVVNFAFPVLEDGRAQSASGNYVFTILKITESYYKLLVSLQDVCDKVKDIEVISPGGKVYHVTWFLGGDCKFLATVCGLESTISTYPCIWCKCPKISDLT